MQTTMKPHTLDNPTSIKYINYYCKCPKVFKINVIKYHVFLLHKINLVYAYAVFFDMASCNLYLISVTSFSFVDTGLLIQSVDQIL